MCPLSNPVESASRLHTHPRPLLSTDDSPDQATTTFRLDSCRSLCPTWPFCFYPTYPPFPSAVRGNFRRVKQISLGVQWLRLHLPAAMVSIPSSLEELRSHVAQAGKKNNKRVNQIVALICSNFPMKSHLIENEIRGS